MVWSLLRGTLVILPGENKDTYSWVKVKVKVRVKVTRVKVKVISFVVLQLSLFTLFDFSLVGWEIIPTDDIWGGVKPKG